MSSSVKPQKLKIFVYQARCVLIKRLQPNIFSTHNILTLSHSQHYNFVCCDSRQALFDQYMADSRYQQKQYRLNCWKLLTYLTSVVLRERNGLSNSNGISTYNRTSIYDHHQNIIKPCFRNTSVLGEVVAVSKIVLAVAKVKPYKKPCRNG